MGNWASGTPPGVCEKYAKKIQEAGFQAKTIVYDNAHHGWGPGVREIEDVGTFGQCMFLLDESAIVYDASTGKNVQSKEKFGEAARKCIWKKTVYIGAEGGVRDAALKDLKAFLSKTLGQ